MTLFSVYSFCWADPSAYVLPNLKTAVAKIGLQMATVAFLISDGSNGIWPTFTAAIPDMQWFVNNGGILTISIGGANGPFIQDYMSQNTMYNVLSNVLSEIPCNRIDFDIEGIPITQPVNYDKFNKVISQLQQTGFPNLQVIYTISVGQPQWGSIQPDGIALINNVIDNNVKNFIINGMLMDLYSTTYVNWGNMSISIMEDMKRQISILFPLKTEKEIYNMLGGTFMSGLQDDKSIFTIDDTVKLTNYIKEKDIGLISYWGLQRDQVGSNAQLYNGINTADFEYYNIIKNILDNHQIIPQSINVPQQSNVGFSITTTVHPCFSPPDDQVFSPFPAESPVVYSPVSKPISSPGSANVLVRGSGSGTYFFDAEGRTCNSEAPYAENDGYTFCEPSTPPFTTLANRRNNNIVALALDQMNANKTNLCGKRVIVKYNGRVVDATFVVWDACAACTGGVKLDFSVSALSAIEPSTCYLGVVPGMEWDVVDEQIIPYVA